MIKNVRIRTKKTFLVAVCIKSHTEPQNKEIIAAIKKKYKSLKSTMVDKISHLCGEKKNNLLI
jgi:hypothetical protein